MRKEFAVHMLNQLGKEKATAIAQCFEAALDDIEAICDGGDQRCLAIVRTKMEEAGFFAKKAMASNVNNQEDSK